MLPGGLAHAGCAEGFAHVQRFKHAGRTHAIDTAPLDEQMRLSSRVYQAQPVAHGILLPGGQGDQFRALPGLGSAPPLTAALMWSCGTSMP
jgi:hypothetical protein